MTALYLKLSIIRLVILDQKTYEHDLQDFSFTIIELLKFKKEKIDDLSNT
jgi:hypothetical protein